MKLRIVTLVAMFFASMLFGVGSASAGAGDVYLKNQSHSVITVKICKDMISSTQCGSTVGYLEPGTNSYTKYGWGDADGVFCGEGYRCQIAASHFDGWGTGSSTRLIKVSGCATTCTIPVYVYRG